MFGWSLFSSSPFFLVLVLFSSINKIVYSSSSSSIFFELYKQENLTSPFVEIGISTSAYQTEGAFLSDSKTYSIWDRFVRSIPSPILDDSTGDQSSLSYYFWKNDIELLKKMNIKNYQISLSWSRLFPTSNFSEPNQIAVTHYKMILEQLHDAGIEPWIVLFHWDLPYYFQQEYGGWISGKIIKDFLFYSDFCFSNFGNLVKNWITIRDPIQFAIEGYQSGNHAPGVKSKVFSFLVAHNMLIAHGEVYYLYTKNYKSIQKGKISIFLHTNFYYPQNPTSFQDHYAKEWMMINELHWFLDPIFLGDYPPLMKGQLEYQIPLFSLEEKQKIQYSIDFLAIEHYSSFDVSFTELGTRPKKYPKSSSFQSAIAWDHIYPPSIYDLISYIYEHYTLCLQEPFGIVLLSGVPTYNSQHYDYPRFELLPRIYYHVLQLCKKYPNFLISHFFIRTLADDFEWEYGYTRTFGLFHVNFTDPLRLRTPKESVSRFFPSYFQ